MDAQAYVEKQARSRYSLVSKDARMLFVPPSSRITVPIMRQHEPLSRLPLPHRTDTETVRMKKWRCREGQFDYMIGFSAVGNALLGSVIPWHKEAPF